MIFFFVSVALTCFAGTGTIKKRITIPIYASIWSLILILIVAVAYAISNVHVLLEIWAYVTGMRRSGNTNDSRNTCASDTASGGKLSDLTGNDPVPAAQNGYCGPEQV